HEKEGTFYSRLISNLSEFALKSRTDSVVTPILVDKDIPTILHAKTDSSIPDPSPDALRELVQNKALISRILRLTPSEIRDRLSDIESLIPVSGLNQPDNLGLIHYKLKRLGIEFFYHDKNQKPLSFIVLLSLDSKKDLFDWNFLPDPKGV